MSLAFYDRARWVRGSDDVEGIEGERRWADGEPADDGLARIVICVRRCSYLDPYSGERYPGVASNWLCDREAGDTDAGTRPSTPAIGENAPTIHGDLTGRTAEDSIASTSGRLVASDADSGDDPTFAAQIATGGAYGTFAIDPAGAWTYALDSATSQGLGGGDQRLGRRVPTLRRRAAHECDRPTSCRRPFD